MTDEDKALVEQLYDQADRRHGSVGALHSLEWKAANRIEDQAAEIEKLREAVKEIKDAWDWWQVDTYDRCASAVDDAISAALGETK